MSRFCSTRNDPIRPATDRSVAVCRRCKFLKQKAVTRINQLPVTTSLLVIVSPSCDHNANRGNQAIWLEQRQFKRFSD